MNEQEAVPQVPPAEPVEVETKSETSEQLPDPPKIEHKIFEVGDEATLDAFQEQVSEFCSKLNFQSMCNEAAMVSGAHRCYVALQTTLEVMRSGDSLDSKTLPELPTHYNKTLRNCVNMYARANEDIAACLERARVYPLACMVVYSESHIGMYRVEEYINVNLKDELLKKREEWVSNNGRRWLNFSVDVLVPGFKGEFFRIVLRDTSAERPFEIMCLDRNTYPIYATEEQTKWVDEFETTHKDTCDPEPILLSVDHDAPPFDPEEYEWEKGNRRRNDNLYEGKYMFKSGVIKLRVVQELEAKEHAALESWRKEYCKFLESIAHKFDMHVLDNICDEEFVVPPNVLMRHDIQKYLSVPTYKHLPGAKLVFLIHGDGGTIIIYNHKEMITSACDVSSRGTIHINNSVV